MQIIIQLLILIISVFFMEAESNSKCPYPEKIYPCVCVDHGPMVTCKSDTLEIMKDINRFNTMTSCFAEFEIISSNLQVLPNSLFMNTTMTTLVLKTPSLRVISNDTLRFIEKSLTRLYINGSVLKSIFDIHPAIKYAFVLDELVVRNSPAIDKIESNAFTNTFHIQSTLRLLDLEYNSIKHIGDNAFNSLKRLALLSLRHNFINEISVTTFPSSYINSYLKEIYLDDNKLNSLNYLLIKELNSGVNMWMVNNNITTISLDDLRLIAQSGDTIHLDGNHIICDKNFMVIALMNSLKHNHNLKGKCFAPQSLKDVEFSDLKPENFTN